MPVNMEMADKYRFLLYSAVDSFGVQSGERIRMN